MTTFRLVVAGCATLVSLGLVPVVAAQDLEVRRDDRIEFVSFLFRAGGRPEYNEGRVPAWNAALDSLAAAHATHPGLSLARRLASQYRVGFFAPVSLAIHLRQDSILRIDPGLEAAPSLHRTWTTYPDSTRAFVSEFSDFWRDARFEDFLRGETRIVDAAERRLRTLVAATVKPGWFGDYWGDSSIKRLRVVPGLTTATASYGLDVVRENGSREGYAIIGVTRTDAAGLAQFDSTDVTRVLHELNHPYVNAVLRRMSPELRQVADTLHRAVAPEMRRLGYGSFDAMLHEALVRAAVIRYLAANVSQRAADEELNLQRSEGFVWMGGLVAAFVEYESQRVKYPAFVEFLPTLTERLREMTERRR